MIVAGALTGLLVGLTGVGGGSLMTPILMLIFGVAPVTAVGTDLWFAASTKLVATRVHHAGNVVDWMVARRMWLGSIPATLITVALIKYGVVSNGKRDVLVPIIGSVVLLSAVTMLFQARLQTFGRSLRLGHTTEFKRSQLPLTIAAGALLGVLVTLTSVGAGAIGAPILAYLYPLRLTPPRLVATDIVHAIPLTIVGGIGHLVIGNVDGGLLGTLLIGSIPGAIIGATLSSRLPHAVVRGAMAVTLIAIGIKLLAS
jgi:uncharacterized membrane protein YfcA